MIARKSGWLARVGELVEDLVHARQLTSPEPITSCVYIVWWMMLNLDAVIRRPSSQLALSDSYSDSVSMYRTCEAVALRMDGEKVATSLRDRRVEKESRKETLPSTSRSFAHLLVTPTGEPLHFLFISTSCVGHIWLAWRCSRRVDFEGKKSPMKKRPYSFCTLASPE